MKKKLILTLTGGLLCLTSSIALADSQGLFLEKCGSCHKKSGQASVVNPADKAGRVWKKYFARGRHPVDMAISEGELDNIISYLVDHAADSDQPASAVIPK